MENKYAGELQLSDLCHRVKLFISWCEIIEFIVIILRLFLNV